LQAFPYQFSARRAADGTTSPARLNFFGFLARLVDLFLTRAAPRLGQNAQSPPHRGRFGVRLAGQNGKAKENSPFLPWRAVIFLLPFGKNFLAARPKAPNKANPFPVGGEGLAVI